MLTQISIVNVKDYKSIQDAVKEAVILIEDNLTFNFSNANSILIKPNLLTGNKNACTNPSFVDGILSYLKEKKIPLEKILIGDSPGQSNESAIGVAKKIGLFEICENYGIEISDFESQPPIKESIDGAIKLKDSFIAKMVKESDILINLPRLKTHAEATMTGAIKNYWGIIPGGLKAKFHLLGKTADQFGEVIADNFSWVVRNKPNRMTIYDLQLVMDGSMGPSSGNMNKWDLILAGTDELALDIVALEIGKFKGIHVPHIKSAIRRQLGVSNINEIEFKGLTLDYAKKITPRFNVPNEFLTKFVSILTGNIAYRMMEKIPELNKIKCKKCGQCAQICPAEAIKFQPNMFPSFNRQKCISCLCCMELCPHNAINPKRKGLKGLLEIF
ncbi:MAG: DUF362 domain-containing protein [Promethearchaeota archaeon]